MGHGRCPSVSGVGSSAAGYAEWAGEIVESLARRFGYGPPGRRGGYGGEDISLSVCGTGILVARRPDMRSGPVRFFRVLPAALVLSRLGTVEVTEGRMLPLRVWHWRLGGRICGLGQRDV